MKNEKEMATNFYFKMATVQDKMADLFFSKQEDEKEMVSTISKGNNLWIALPYCNEMPHERPKKDQTKRADETQFYQHNDEPRTKEPRNIQRR